MDQTQFTPLRLGLLIMLGILVVGSLFFRYWPGRYDEPVGKSLERVAETGSLTPEVFYDLQKQQDQKLLVIDIRSAEAYEAGHMDGAVHYPAENLLERKTIRKLKDKMVLVYGDSGGESSRAATLLQMTGINAQAADRGYTDLLGAQGGKRKVGSEAEAFKYREYFKALENTPGQVIEVKVPTPKAGGC